ncbi:hypothetical protein [Microbispora triticiradicis]|uniref:DUF2269 family protein n=2 Tax=Microbispora TaxID=2005 RepID=A0ABY3LW59_9ACTN|nr:MULTISPECIES: hypothetical protein [Microbispora]TLP54539.1 hypothetical protein FED44_27690 [Microbispora fusca]TYB56483.1 hypothetical protein FXF59_20315 [Microbispora tritici]
MTAFFLAVHVLAAILAIGPVAVAASMFPAAARRVTDASVRGGQADGLAALRVLHRVCRVYALAGLAVPVFGFATASGLGVLRDAWVIASILLTGAAAAILALWVLPRQDAVLALLTAGDPTAAGIGRQVARLAMLTGVFNLLWAAVTVLMIVRPGSTTGV